MKMAFLNLKSIFREDVLSDGLHTLGMMGNSHCTKLLRLVVEMM
jgi:hypothetical protein